MQQKSHVELLTALVPVKNKRCPIELFTELLMRNLPERSDTPPLDPACAAALEHTDF